MKKISKFFCVLLSLLIVILSLASCKKDNEKKSSTEIDDSVTIKIPVSRSESYNPFDTESDFNSKIMTLLYDGLVKVKDDLTYENCIASTVKVSGKSVQVSLKNNIYFSDNVKLTASDVVYSFELAKESENYSVRLANFESASKSGDNEVVFNLVNEDIYAANCLDFPIIEETRKVEKSDNEEADEDVEIPDFPIGSGRYKYLDDSHNVLVMNELWYGEELPKTRRVELVNLLDISAAVDSMETGNISFLFQDLSSGQFNRVNAETSEILMTNLVFLGINSYSNALSKPEVRQAISLTVDKKSIVDNSFLGYAVVADTPFLPTWTELKNIHFDSEDLAEDLREADNLLESAGYAEENAAGTKTSEDLSLKLLVNSDNAYKVSAAEEIASGIKKLGINVTISKLSFDEYVTALQNVDYDLYIGEVKLTNNMSLSAFFSEDGAASYGINQDTDMTKIYKSFKAGETKMQRFVDYFAVAVPFIPLCYRKGISAYTNEMKHESDGIQSDIYDGIYTWSY